MRGSQRRRLSTVRIQVQLSITLVFMLPVLLYDMARYYETSAYLPMLTVSMFLKQIRRVSPALNLFV